MRLLIASVVLLAIGPRLSHECPDGCVCTTEFVGDLLDPYVDCGVRDFTSVPEDIPDNTTHL